jgi:hypothetical protein
MAVVAWLIVAAISFFAGGFAIPIGFALGLSAIEVYIAASIGSMAGLAAFMAAGDKIRSWLRNNRPPPETDENESADDDSRIRAFAARYGERGLGLVGPIFPGVTASVVLGFALGMNRASLARWLMIGIAVMFALYCGGLWLLIDTVGLEE